MYIEKIAYHLNRRDEVPNQELAKELAMNHNKKGVKEVASYLFDSNKSIASDCLKVLYEIGYTNPQLMDDYLEDYIQLLNSKNNRMVWGSMIALANVSKTRPDDVYQHISLIRSKMKSGTVITHVWGVYTLIQLADHGYYEELIDELFELQKTCRPVDFAKRAESIAPILKSEDYPEFLTILLERLNSLSAAQQKRVKKVIKTLQ